MDIRLKCADKSTHRASEMLLAQNIETCWDTVPGLLSDRLENPKFVGPAHALTGVAPCWEGSSCTGAFNHLLAPGTGLLGTEAQLLRSNTGLTQNKRQVRKGETLVVETWARCMGRPATLAVSLLPMPSRQAAYANAEITLDSPQYQRYTAELTVPVDDDDACFAIGVKGDGDVWLDQVHLRPKGEDLLCAEMIKQISTLRIPALRFPGGIVSTNYSWRHGTGPVHLRPTVHDAAFYRDWYIYYDFGTDEYLQLCLDQGITPTITVNVGTGNVDEAAGWARYVAEWFRSRCDELPLAYWHIGNHPYHATMAWMDPEMYVRTVREYAPAIREAYPNCRIVGVSGGPAADGGQKGDWLNLTLDEVGGLLDVIQCQTYGGQELRPAGRKGWEPGKSDPTELMSSMVQNVCDLQKVLKTFVDQCRKRDLKTNIGVAEWNYWAQASHRDGHGFLEPYYTIHALFVAGMLNGFTRLAPDMEVAHFYNLVNPMGIFQHYGADVEVLCLADVFKLYRPAYPGEFIPVEIDGAPDLGKNKALDAVCLRNDQGTWLIAINASPSESATIALSGFPEGVPETMGIAGNAPEEYPEPVSIEARNGKAVIPPMSLVRLHWK